MPESELPIDFFKKFFKDEIIKVITDSTNEYSVEKNGYSLNVSVDEMEQYIGILIHMGVVTSKDYTMYWSKETLYPTIADTMPRNR